MADAGRAMDWWMIVGIGALCVVLLAALVVAGFAWRNLTYFRRRMARVRAAGFVDRSVEIDGARYAYAEGPDRGPALLLIHGQGVDRWHYARALPQLAERYHVFAVDCLGHGASERIPERYTASRMGADLAVFLREVVGEPALVSGHSSGGHLAAWLAAEAPEAVRGALLEDPPYFTTLLPRARQTWNWVDLASTAHGFLASGERDFPLYSAEHSRMWSLFGGLAPMLLRAARRQRAKRSGRPIRWWLMPPAMNEMYRGLEAYDPCFGEAFYTGSWDAGWEHDDVLSRIRQPSILVHTKVRLTDDGILQAAMSNEEADRASALLPDGEQVRTKTGHGFHDEDPGHYVRLVDRLRKRSGR